MSVGATRIRIETLTRELFRAWEETHCDWQDSRAQEFEGKYLVELRTRMERASTAMEKLDQLLRKVRTDCE